MELTVENVNAIVVACLPKIEDNPDNLIYGDGLVIRMAFDPEKINKNREHIISMLEQLPDEFQEGKGNGWSFLQMCYTKEGVHWGEHQDMDKLVCLGRSIKKVMYLLPRNMWEAFPGGVPYLMVKKEL